MPGGLQCSMHWFPPPVNYPSQYDPGCWTRRKTTNKSKSIKYSYDIHLAKRCFTIGSYLYRFCHLLPGYSPQYTHSCSRHLCFCRSDHTSPLLPRIHSCLEVKHGFYTNFNLSNQMLCNIFSTCGNLSMLSQQKELTKRTVKGCLWLVFQRFADLIIGEDGK